MIKIGHEGWLRLNLGATNYQSPLSADFDKHDIDTTMSFKGAVSKTAMLISSKYNNLTLCLSGGLDSEYVAVTLLEHGIPFTPLIFVTPINREEVWYAQYFCDRHGLNPVIVDYTSDDKYNDLLRKVLIKSAKLDILPVNGIVPNIIADLYPDAQILHGFGEPRGTTTPFYNLNYTESMNDTIEINDHHFFLDLEFGDKHPGPFFSYTPELFYTFARELDFSVNTQICKLRIYEDLLPRPKFFKPLFSGETNVGVKVIFDNTINKYCKLPADRFAQNITRQELFERLVK